MYVNFVSESAIKCEKSNNLEGNPIFNENCGISSPEKMYRSKGEGSSKTANLTLSDCASSKTVSFLSRKDILFLRLGYCGNQRKRTGDNRVHLHT